MKNPFPAALKWACCLLLLFTAQPVLWGQQDSLPGSPRGQEPARQEESDRAPSADRESPADRAPSADRESPADREAEPVSVELPHSYAYLPEDMGALDLIIGDLSRGYVESLYSASRRWIPGDNLRSPRVQTMSTVLPPAAPTPETGGEAEYLMLIQEWDLDELPGPLRSKSASLFTGYRLRLEHLYLLSGDGEDGERYLGTRLKLHGIERAFEDSSGSGGDPHLLPGAPLLSWPGIHPSKTQGAVNAASEVRGSVTETLLLLELHYNSTGNISLFIENLYDRSLGFLSQTRWENGRIREFSYARDGDRGFREIIRDEQRDILSLRRYDDGGRIEFKNSPESRVEMRYSADGGRREEEQFPGGGREIRRYRDDNLLESSRREYPDGRVEERSFSYNDQGDILMERYEGPLGVLETSYSYREGRLAEVVSTRDGKIFRKLEYEGNEVLETRYIRGEAVLRVVYEGERRIYEEELVNGEVVRRREYGQSAAGGSE